jgi:hypothetical protein
MQWRAMAQGKSSEAAGSILAISIITGVVGGTVAGEPSIGFLVGTFTGILLALLFWLWERKK